MDRRGLLGLGLAAGLAGGAGPRLLQLRASARSAGLPFRAGDFAMAGIFDLDWLDEPRFERVLDAMAGSPGGFEAVRVFGALNAGSREMDFPTASGGTWADPAAEPDFAVTLGLLERLVGRGLTPFLALTFFPPAVSPSPIAPPADLGRWQRLVRGFLDRAAARFGAEEVARWWLEAWNEPNMPNFWAADFDRYLALYRATAEAVRASGHRVQLGGPALAWMPGGEGEALMERFLRFLAASPDLQCDFLSYHRKGAWTVEEGAPRLERLVQAAERTAEAALRLVPERCARGLVLVNNEADMRVGFQHPYQPRLTERFPCWLAASAVAHARLSARYAARGLRFMAAADHANQQLVQEPFDGRRALFTPVAPGRMADLVKLPVFGFHEMLRLLGDGLCVAEMPQGGLHHLLTSDAARIGALVAWQAEEAVALDWVIEDIPWPRVNLALFRIDARLSNSFAAAGRRMPAPAFEPEEARRLRLAAELAEAVPIRRAIQAGGRLRLTLRLDPFTTVLASITPFEDALPATPARIEAVADAGNVRLRWTPNRGPRFHGYEVVRLDRRGLIAPFPLRGATWVDTAPPHGVPLRYGVRAVSASGARSGMAEAPPLIL
jgi:hypothetical protein